MEEGQYIAVDNGSRSTMSFFLSSFRRRWLLDWTGSSGRTSGRSCRGGSWIGFLVTVVVTLSTLVIVGRVARRMLEPEVDGGLNVCVGSFTEDGSTRRDSEEDAEFRLSRPSSSVTLVSAFLARPGETSVPEPYADLMRNFLSLDARMVLFLDSIGRNFTLMHRTDELLKHSTELVNTSWQSMYVAKYDWRAQRKKDWWFLLRRPESYQLRNEKVQFLSEASQRDPFGSTHFYWVDMDVFRHADLVKELGSQQWPSPDILLKFPKLLLLQTSPFRLHETDLNFEHLRNPFQEGLGRAPPRIETAIFGGSKQFVLDWSAVYYRVLDRFFLRNLFAGAETSVFAATAIIYPDLVTRIPPRMPNPKLNWAYLIDFLRGQFHCDIPLNVDILTPLTIPNGSELN